MALAAIELALGLRQQSPHELDVLPEELLAQVGPNTCEPIRQEVGEHTALDRRIDASQYRLDLCDERRVLGRYFLEIFFPHTRRVQARAKRRRRGW